MVASEMRETSNVTGFDQGLRPVWTPRSVAEVQDCVAEARRLRCALYPVSTGMNWGYGSAAPVAPDSILLDLSAMREVRNLDRISLANPVAVLEPGVTQAALSDALSRVCPQLDFNVTGSSAATSILGNALDRGVGYWGPRYEDVFGLEVVTGRGELLKTGFRRLGEGSPLAHLHPFGLGPVLDGLFFQANLGIVTSACFKLRPRPQRSVAVSLALREESRLAEFLDRLALLKRLGVMGGVNHVGNKARTHASMMSGVSEYLRQECGVGAGRLVAEAERAVQAVAPYEWTSLGGVSGSAAQVRAALAEVKRSMSGIARVTVVDDAKLDLGFGLLHPLRGISSLARANAAAIAAIRPLHGLATGKPTNAAIDNLLWRYGHPEWSAQRLDETNCGLLFVNPALPMDGAAAVAAVQCMQATAGEFGHKLYLTLNIETPTSMVAVANLLFDRSSEAETVKAQACARALRQTLRARGLEVYRARADMMSEVVDPQDPFWQTVWRLKSVFDPDQVIAPGRYNLARAPDA